MSEPKYFARSYASHMDGSNLPVSIALIACRDTPTFSPSSFCVSPRLSRSSFMPLIKAAPPPHVRFTLHQYYTTYCTILYCPNQSSKLPNFSVQAKCGAPYTPSIKKTARVCELLLMSAFPIFPASRPASIFGDRELNFCVRYGNRWTLTPINTDCKKET